MTVSCLLIVYGCRQEALANEIRVRKGLRLFPRELSFPSPSNGVIRIAVQPSPTPVDLEWHSFEITEGSITIHGRNGTFRIGRGNTFSVDIEDFGSFTGKFNKAMTSFTLSAKKWNR